MAIEDLRKQSAQELDAQLLELRREEFNLRMQKAAGQQAQTHHFKRVRREIAQIKTLLTEKSAAVK